MGNPTQTNRLRRRTDLVFKKSSVGLVTDQTTQLQIKTLIAGYGGRMPFQFKDVKSRSMPSFFKEF